MLTKYFKNTSTDNINVSYMLFIFIRFLKIKDILQSWNWININSLMISCPISIKGILKSTHQPMVPLPCFYLNYFWITSTEVMGEKQKSLSYNSEKLMASKLPWQGLRAISWAQLTTKRKFLDYIPHSRWSGNSYAPVCSQSPLCFISVWHIPQYSKGTESNYFNIFWSSFYRTNNC